MLSDYIKPSAKIVSKAPCFKNVSSIDSKLFSEGISVVWGTLSDSTGISFKLPSLVEFSDTIWSLILLKS